MRWLKTKDKFKTYPKLEGKVKHIHLLNNFEAEHKNSNTHVFQTADQYLAILTGI